MITLEIILTILAIICLADLIYLIGKSSGVGLTYAICAPLFGLLYGLIKMRWGLIIRLIEAMFVGAGILIWF